MFVKERMTATPVVVAPDVSVPQALKLMHDRHIRRLPVVDKSGHLVGIVSDRDLLRASPSPATSLSVWEITYLLNEVKVQSVMTAKVISVTEGTPLEDAARIMADNKIGGLPVVSGDELVGIITETDLFRAFVELLGAGDAGVRVTMVVRNQPGELARLTRAIADSGGNISALAEYKGATPDERRILVKASGVARDALVAALTPAVLQIEDVRET
jgi:acetoin utilization protein AcuB